MPGFVTDTRLEPGARIVTFANGVTVREPIVTLDEAARRLVWTVEGLRTTHYNASARAFDDPALYEAAHTLLVRSTKWSSLRAWGMEVARRRGMARARVAMARKLGVILHRMWRDGTDFRFGRDPAAAA